MDKLAVLEVPSCEPSYDTPRASCHLKYCSQSSLPARGHGDGLYCWYSLVCHYFLVARSLQDGAPDRDWGGALAEEADDMADAGAEVEAEAGLEVDEGGMRLMAVSSCSVWSRAAVDGTGSTSCRSSRGWSRGLLVICTSVVTKSFGCASGDDAASSGMLAVSGKAVNESESSRVICENHSCKSSPSLIFLFSHGSESKSRNQ